MAAPLRLAFLGIDHPHGAAWRQNLRDLASEAQTVAIVPGFSGSIASLEESLVHIPRFETVQELIAWGEFDAALVCLSNQASITAIEQLAQAGKAILAEKPVAATLSEFRAAAHAVRQAQIPFQSGYVWRYHPAAERLRQMVADRQFGRLISIEMSWATTDVRRRDPDHYLFDPQQSGGGFLNWLGCHWLNLLPFITGQTVTAVTGRLGNYGETPLDMDDGGAAILELEPQTLATFQGGYWLPRWTGEMRWTLRGTQRWLHWDAARAGTGGVFEIHGPQPHFHPMDETFVFPVDPTPGYGGASGRALVRDWLAAIRGEPVTLRCDLESTCQTLSLMNAISESSRTGQRVRLQAAE